MAEAQYDNYFIRGSKSGGTSDYDKRITAYIDDDIIKGSFYFSGMFMAPQFSTGIKGAHLHPYDEILFFHDLHQKLLMSFPFHPFSEPSPPP